MRKCLNCNKKTNNPKFCSLSCSSKYNSGRRNKAVIKQVKICLKCEIPFEAKDGREKFCSRSCSASFNNALKPKRQRNSESNCLNCNSPISDRRNKRKYCSNQCSHEHKKKVYIENWLADPSFATNNDGNLSSAVRNYLIEQAENKCKCGFNTINKFTGKVPLTINHIDGNSRNNKPENLEVLCYRCHSLTENFGALNKGNSNRLDRRHKYRQGQMIEHGEYKFIE